MTTKKHQVMPTQSCDTNNTPCLKIGKHPSIVSPPTTNKKNQNHDGQGTAVLERITLKIKRPPQYQVWLLNDDYTPMDFVVFVLQEMFGKDRHMATQIMLKIHLEGKAVCGVFTKDIAMTKSMHVAALAKENGHPLQCLALPEQH